MELKELFLKRQSTREYSDRPVETDKLKKICELAQLAPSAINAQPYKMYAIAGGKAKSFAKNIQKDGANEWASGCTAFIVIEQLEARSVTRGERVITNAEFIPNDVGILAAYIALAAEDMGVQNCIVGLRDEKGIAEFLGLPETARFPLVIALGYAAEGYPVREKRRRDFEKAVTVLE